MAASPRVDQFMALFAELTDVEKQMVRAMVQFRTSGSGPEPVESARRQLLAQRLAASVPFKISAGARR